MSTHTNELIVLFSTNYVGIIRMLKLYQN